MPPIEAQVKDLLDETRLAMLGTQLLAGLQYRAAFSEGFRRLPIAMQLLDCVALFAILLSIALLLSTPSFHQIAEQGHATGRLVRRASGALQGALPPIALALGVNAAIGIEPNAGGWAAGVAAVLFVIGAILVWHVVPAIAARRRQRPEETMEDKLPSLEARIVQGLTELRVVIPGAQAMFGFQVSAVLTDSFSRLSAASTTVHLISLGLIVIAIVLLIAPTTYHRIAAGGDAEEAVLRYMVRMMLLAEGLIALALIGDAYVTVRMVTGHPAFAVALSAAAAIGFTTLLYAVPLAARRNR